MTADLNLREAWAGRAVEIFRPWFDELGSPIPAVIRVSIGWPKSARGAVVGFCFPTEATEDGSVQIFLTPERGESDTLDVLGTIVHELQHSADNCASGHKGDFARLNKAMGFLGKPTTSKERTPELQAKLQAVADEIGPFPNPAITPIGKLKPQTTRMLKLTCQGCGMVVRCTRKWLDEVGPPSCACEHGPMEPDAG
jgi:hypothetical protein